MNDEQIIRLINNKEYSELSFLEDRWKLSENENYMGYYFFLWQEQGKETKKIKKEIKDKFNSESLMHSYLGNISHKIYKNKKTHQHKYLFELAIKEDEKNYEAYLGLYNITHNIEYALIALDHIPESEEIKILNLLINIHPYNFLKLSPLDLKKIKVKIESVININERCRKHLEDILLLCHLYLGDNKSAIEIYNKHNKFSLEILKKLLSEKLINKKEAAKKIHNFQLQKFFENDKKNLLKTLSEKRFNKNENTRDLFFETAFETNNFKEIIRYYNKKILNKKSNKAISIKTKLFYIISQQISYNKTNTEIKNEILNAFHLLDETLLSLLYTVKTLEYLISLKKELSKRKNTIRSENHNTSQQCIRTFEKSNLHLYYPEIYKTINESINKTQEKWESSLNFKELNEELSLYLSDNNCNMNRLISLSIRTKKIDLALYLLNKLHKSKKPSTSSLNAKAICYELRGEIDKAETFYKKATDKLKESNESDFNIESNYLEFLMKYREENINSDLKHKKIEVINKKIANEFNSSDWEIMKTTHRKTLYKYSTFNINTIDSISNQYFYLSSKEQLNDPIEFPNFKELTERYYIGKEYRICSFTNNSNSMLMWSHYTQDHQGVMIEYWFGGEIPDEFGVDKVSYADEPKRSIDGSKYIFNQYVLTKNKDWSYENEVRLFAYKKNKVYYEKFDGIDNDKSKINAQILSITLGCKFPDHKKELIINIAKSLNLQRNDDNQKIKIKQAYIPEENLFSIRYKTIYDPEIDL